MPRIAIPSRDAAPEASQAFLAHVHQQFGVVPNLFRLMAVSPAVAAGYAGLSGALAKTLDLKTRARIAIAVAQVDGCDYCLSAHSYLGLNLAKLSPEEVALARRGASNDPRADAATRFAATVIERRGQVSDDDLAAVRAAGFNDAEILEMVGLVAENVLTNFLNNVAQTEIDFPVVTLAAA